MSTVAAAIPRPTVAPEGMSPRADVMDVRRLYSTSTGEEPKTFSSLGGTLDPMLLQALDKMGFE